MRPHRHRLGHRLGREARPEWEAAADRLGDRHDVGRDAGSLVSEQPTRAAHAALHLVEDEEQPASVAELAQAPQLLSRELAHAALALHRFEQDASGLIADRRLDGTGIAERHLVEALDLRTEPFEIFRLAAGGDRRKRAAVEGALEADEAIAVALAARIMIAPGH